MPNKRGLSQEALKLIACLTMLIDHIAAALMPWRLPMRVIGRIAFPIYCFLLAEGVHYTRDPKQYGIRLALFAALSEIPFDMALFGGLTQYYQNVMLTLLLGFLMLETMKQINEPALKVLVMIPFALAAEWLETDYGGYGVVLIWVFGIFRGDNLMCLLGAAAVCWAMNSFRISVLGLRIPIEMFALLAMLPICFYSGKKQTSSRWLQVGFYFFYPVHLTILWFLQII